MQQEPEPGPIVLPSISMTPLPQPSPPEPEPRPETPGEPEPLPEPWPEPPPTNPIPPPEPFERHRRVLDSSQHPSNNRRRGRLRTHHVPQAHVRPVREVTRVLAHRCESGTHVRLRGPMYADCGRMMRLARCCSRACAIQPLTRLIANVGVKSSTSRSNPCSSSAV